MNDIFTNQDEVVENLKSAAEELGINPDSVDINRAANQPQFYAKKNCDWCWGRGFVFFVPNSDCQRRPVLKKNASNQSSGWLKNRARKKLVEGRSTCKPEPLGYKQLAGSYAFCRCVTLIKEEKVAAA